MNEQQRWILKTPHSLIIVENDGWGRVIGDDGYAYDFTKTSDFSLFAKVQNEGKECVACPNSPHPKLQSRRRRRLE